MSAAVGAGHDGAARVWQQVLENAGYAVDIRDLLSARCGKWSRRGPVPRQQLARLYGAVLLHAPWIYGVLFRAANGRAGAYIGRLMLRLFLASTADLVQAVCVASPADRSKPHNGQSHGPTAVVCTYPMASHLLGWLRSCGRIRVPVFVYLTDLSVHRLCVSEQVDGYLTVHTDTASRAVELGAVTALSTGPLVDRRYRRRSRLVDSSTLRANYGLPEGGDRLALLVAGSWGTGQIERAAAEICRCGVATPVIVCGRNEKLRARLSKRGYRYVLGWVDDMAELMGAVDVLVENAGGLTSLEALAVGLPVASYRPIAGHGRANAAALAKAGLSTYIRDHHRLERCLTELLHADSTSPQQQVADQLFASGEPVATLEHLLQVSQERCPTKRSVGPVRVTDHPTRAVAR